MLNLKNMIFTVVVLLLANNLAARTAEAIFAGGHFWRLEAVFSKMDGVLLTVAGFDGGSSKNPDYDALSSGHTDYAEAVRVIYNPDRTTYKQLIEYFWKNIDPTAVNAQFCDQGSQFRTAIFYLNDEQKAIALTSKQKIEKKFNKVYTAIEPSTQFYAADASQQGYFNDHPIRYRYYLYRCGHEARIAEIWKHK